MKNEISNSEDVLDVRDIIERFEELEEIIQDETEELENESEIQKDEYDKDIIETATCGECGGSWNDAAISSKTPTPSGRCPFEYTHSEREEHKQLKELLDELAGNGGDHQWQGVWYPVTLIRDSYFEDYAQETAEECCEVPSDLKWPYTCIDWEKAARELQMDYTTVEFDGVTYWYR